MTPGNSRGISLILNIHFNTLEGISERSVMEKELKSGGIYNTQPLSDSLEILLNKPLLLQYAYTNNILAYSAFVNNCANLK